MPAVLYPISLNVTDILLSPAKPFHIILGAHGIGKSTAVQRSAAEVSKFRPVRYLEFPPAKGHNNLLLQFFDVPMWLDFFEYEMYSMFSQFLIN